jgi:lipopolysaccharide/colanic/teichoic acid biosynthesis glycosyltransferase
MVRRGRAVLPEKKAINQDGFAGAVNSVAAVGLCELAIRFIELVAGVACLALLAPMLLLVLIAIKLDSRGPIFVRETRYGCKNRVIQVCKFRAATVCSKDEQGTARLTRVGQLLRQTGIEELPMLINVLAGEMSIIGPTPSAYPTGLLNERKPGIIRWAEILSSQNHSPD